LNQEFALFYQLVQILLQKDRIKKRFFKDQFTLLCGVDFLVTSYTSFAMEFWRPGWPPVNPLCALFSNRNPPPPLIILRLLTNPNQMSPCSLSFFPKPLPFLPQPYSIPVIPLFFSPLNYGGTSNPLLSYSDYPLTFCRQFFPFPTPPMRTPPPGFFHPPFNSGWAILTPFPFPDCRLIEIVVATPRGFWIRPLGFVLRSSHESSPCFGVRQFSSFR